MMKEKGSKQDKGNPIWNTIKTEWEYLGSRRNVFITFLILFTISGIIALMTPLVIGLIFNSIQNSITSEAEFKKLVILISMIFFIQLGSWAFHGIARVLEGRTGFFVRNNYTNKPDFRASNKMAQRPPFRRYYRQNKSGKRIN